MKTIISFLTQRHPCAQDVASITGLGKNFAGIRMVCVDKVHFQIFGFSRKWTYPESCDGLCCEEGGAYQVKAERRELSQDEASVLAAYDRSA